MRLFAKLGFLPTSGLCWTFLDLSWGVSFEGLLNNSRANRGFWGSLSTTRAFRSNLLASSLTQFCSDFLVNKSLTLPKVVAIREFSTFWVVLCTWCLFRLTFCNGRPFFFLLSDIFPFASNNFKSLIIQSSEQLVVFASSIFCSISERIPLSKFDSRFWRSVCWFEISSNFAVMWLKYLSDSLMVFWRLLSIEYVLSISEVEIVFSELFFLSNSRIWGRIVSRAAITGVASAWGCCDGRGDSFADRSFEVRPK